MKKSVAACIRIPVSEPNKLLYHDDTFKLEPFSWHHFHKKDEAV